MDATTLQARVYSGYAKAALRVGLSYSIYRPTSAANPLAGGNLIGTTPAAFTVHSANDFNFGKPSDYEKPTFHALLDGAAVNQGDYLVNAAALGTFFIAEKSPLVPILAVQCNRIISFATPGGVPFTDGTAASYSGTVGEAGATNETLFLTAWPASVLQGARTVATRMLPGDVGLGMWTIYLPLWPGTNIASGDIISDDLGNRYVIRTAELTDLGWRINAQQADT